jgi:hypothetical protein
MKRWVFWPILIIGDVFIAFPLSIGMIGKANAGAKMMSDFKPVMKPATVTKTADYYDHVFTNLRPVAQAMTPETVARFNAYLQGLQGVQAESPKLVAAMARVTHMTPAQAQQFLSAQFPAMSQMFAALPQMGKDFGGLLTLMAANLQTFQRVPPGLDHYAPLVRTMQKDVNNYKKANSLPSFRFLPWFFIVPGILLVGFAGYGLLNGRRGEALRLVDRGKEHRVAA